MRAIKVEWKTVQSHTAYLGVPNDFEAGDYNMEDLLGELDEDDFVDGNFFERQDIETYDTRPRETDEVMVIPGLHEFRVL